MILVGRQMPYVLPLSVAGWYNLRSGSCSHFILACSTNWLRKCQRGFQRIQIGASQPTHTAMRPSSSLTLGQSYFQGVGTFTYVPYSEELNFWCAVYLAISTVSKRGNPSLEHLE